MADKKFTKNHLYQTKKGRSAIVYKMHGKDFPFCLMTVIYVISKDFIKSR
ncbi:hypothetical protein [Acinetobacter seifertii]